MAWEIRCRSVIPDQKNIGYSRLYQIYRHRHTRHRTKTIPRHWQTQDTGQRQSRNTGRHKTQDKDNPEIPADTRRRTKTIPRHRQTQDTGQRQSRDTGRHKTQDRQSRDIGRHKTHDKDNPETPADTRHKTKTNQDCLCPVSCVCRCLGIVFVMCLVSAGVSGLSVLCLVSAGVSGLSLSCVLCLPVSRDCLCPASCVCRCLGIVFVLCLVSAGVSGLSLSCVLCLPVSRDCLCPVSCVPVSRDCLCPVSCVCRCLRIVFVLCLVFAGVSGMSLSCVQRHS
jgi:hypothetical protein